MMADSLKQLLSHQFQSFAMRVSLPADLSALMMADRLEQLLSRQCLIFCQACVSLPADIGALMMAEYSEKQLGKKVAKVRSVHLFSFYVTWLPCALEGGVAAHEMHTQRWCSQ
jgi:hypothetical protein